MTHLSPQDILTRQKAKNHIATIADERDDDLNDWEQTFFNDMLAKMQSPLFVPSPKQLACLQRIAEEDEDDYRSAHERD